MRKLDNQGLNRHLESTVELKHHVLMTIVRPVLETTQEGKKGGKNNTQYTASILCTLTQPSANFSAFNTHYLLQGTQDLEMEKLKHSSVFSS